MKKKVIKKILSLFKKLTKNFFNKKNQNVFEWEHSEDAKKLYEKSKVRYLLTNLKWNEK